jgi:hypothetical protein
VTTPARVLARWAADEIPVKNKDTGRVVYVLPETLRDQPQDFEKLSPNEDPRKRPERAERPDKPRRPRIPRDPPPAPVKPPRPPKPPKVPKPPKPVPTLDPPKVPEPSPFRKWKKLKEYKAHIVARFLARSIKEALEAVELTGGSEEPTARQAPGHRRSVG